MAKTDGVVTYIRTHPNEAVAQGDYDVVKDLHALGAVGSYDAAAITKDDDGKVHVNKDETSTRHGGLGRYRGRRAGRAALPTLTHRVRLCRRRRRRRGRASVEGPVPLRRQGVRRADRRR